MKTKQLCTINTLMQPHTDSHTSAHRQRERERSADMQMQKAEE